MNRLKNWISPYISNIVRFWTNQIVSSILGISVGLATIKLGNFPIALIGSIFTVGFVTFLQYDNMFQLGEKHHFKHVDQLRPSKSLGLYLTLISCSPIFLLLVIGFVLQLSSLDSGATICQLIYYALQGCFLQLHAYVLEIFHDDFAYLTWLIFLLYTLPIILFPALGYFLGSKDRTLRSFFGLGHIGKKNKH